MNSGKPDRRPLDANTLPPAVTACWPLTSCRNMKAGTMIAGSSFTAFQRQVRPCCVAPGVAKTAGHPHAHIPGAVAHLGAVPPHQGQAAPARRSTRIAFGKHTPAATSAAPIAAAAAESWITATGVPLLEVLKQMSLEQAALRSAGLIAATVVGVILGNKLLALVGAKVRIGGHAFDASTAAVAQP